MNVTKIRRPSDMERITTPELAQAFIKEQIQIRGKWFPVVIDPTICRIQKGQKTHCKKYTGKNLPPLPLTSQQAVYKKQSKPIQSHFHYRKWHQPTNSPIKPNNPGINGHCIPLSKSRYFSGSKLQYTSKHQQNPSTGE